MLLDDFIISNGKETVKGPEAVSGRDASVIAQGAVEEVTYRLLQWTATQQIDHSETHKKTLFITVQLNSV